MPRTQHQQEQFRAAYPEESRQEMLPRTQDDWAAYPDMVYQARPQQPPPRPAPQRQSAWAQGSPPRKLRNTALWAFVALLCAVLLCLMGYFAVSLYQEYPLFRQKAAIVAQDTFAQGVLVDGVHIGGMTRQQAESALRKENAQGKNGLHITLQVDGRTWILTENELPFERNLASVLDTAYAIGRQGTPETLQSGITPFEYRYQHLYHTASTPAYLYTQVTFDQAKLRELVGIIEGNINREAVDAQVATFDFVNRQFTFTEDVQGAYLDGEALYQRLLSALNNKEYQAVISVESTPILPRVTRVELMNSFSLISSFTTTTTSDASRNNNINLSCQAINGTALMPGESFSFNTATGQRTAEKGYLPAAAIAGGTTVDEVGGGVCQTSGTLFNAAVMADMTILTRSPHAWPSNYVDKGRDATVNWPNLDFVFRNDRTTPIFIVAYYQQRKCTVEIYGASLGAGISIDMATKTISTTNPPQEPLYEQNPSLEPGTIQEKKKARTGYVVETYRIYKKNGVEYKRELLCTSTYKMIQQVIEFN